MNYNQNNAEQRCSLRAIRSARSSEPERQGGVFDNTKQYLRGYFLGAPIYLLGQLTTPYLQTMGRRRNILWSMAAMIASDVAFDLLSVFVFRGGMFGIALASSLSYLLSLAAFSVISAPANLLYQIGLGCGEVTLLLAAFSYNEEDRDSLHTLFGTAVPYTFLLIAAAVFATELSAPWIVILFLGRTSPIHGITVMGLRLFALALIPTCINCVLEKYYPGVRRKGLSIMLAVRAGAALTIPCAWAGGKWTD